MPGNVIIQTVSIWIEVEGERDREREVQRKRVWEREVRSRKQEKSLFCLLVIVSLCLLANNRHTSPQFVMTVRSASFSTTAPKMTGGASLNRTHQPIKSFFSPYSSQTFRHLIRNVTLQGQTWLRPRILCLAHGDSSSNCVWVKADVHKIAWMHFSTNATVEQDTFCLINGQPLYLPQFCPTSLKNK